VHGLFPVLTIVVNIFVITLDTMVAKDVCSFFQENAPNLLIRVHLDSRYTTVGL
jgi:hypothetical protein